MTTIAAIHTQGAIHMAADEQITGGDRVFAHLPMRKIHTVFSWTIGIAGPVAATQAMLRGLQDASSDRLTDMLQEARQYMLAHGLRGDHNAEGMVETHVQMLAAHPTLGLFLVAEDLSVMSIPPGGYWAIGSGAPYALGSMSCSAGKLGFNPEAIPTQAVRDASNFCVNTGAPKQSVTVRKPCGSVQGVSRS